MNNLKLFSASTAQASFTPYCEVTIPKEVEILKIQARFYNAGPGGVTGSNFKIYLNDTLISDYIDDELFSSLPATNQFIYETLAYNGLKLENKENKIKIQCSTSVATGQLQIDLNITAFA